MGDLIGNIARYCAKETHCGDISGHYYAKEIKQRFDRICISFMQYHLTNFTTQTINYTYDKLNQLTSVSNYGNLGLKDVYQYDSRGNITRKDCYNASSNALNGYSLYQYDTARLDQLSNYTLYDSAGAVVSTRDYTYDGIAIKVS